MCLCISFGTSRIEKEEVQGKLKGGLVPDAHCSKEGCLDSYKADTWKSWAAQYSSLVALSEDSRILQRQATKLAEDKMPGVQHPGLSPHLSFFKMFS